MQKITPCIWYNFNAEQAVTLYKSIFKDDLKELDKLYYDDSHPYGKAGEVLTIEFELFGQYFVALNGGPQFPHTDAVSFMIQCKDQAEIDYYWDAFLKSGGTEEQCGWIRDRFGLAWQITPTVLLDMHKSRNPAKAKAVMAAMMEMIKLDITELERAYDEA